MNRRILLVTAIMAALSATTTAHADFVIGAFDGTRSDRPFSGSDYSNIRADLSNTANFGPGGIVNQAVTFAPSISTATPAALSGLNLLVISEVNGSGLSSSEITAVTNFVLGGGCLVLVTDSNAPAANAVTQMLSALDGGSTGGFSGNNGGTAGSIVGTSTATSGPFGNIVGQSYASTIGLALNPGSQSTVIGTNVDNQMLEIAPGALGAGSGGVLATGDVSFMNFFVPPASLYPNANNAILFENFVAGQAGAGIVPEPSSLILAGLGFCVVVGMSCRRRKSEA